MRPGAATRRRERVFQKSLAAVGSLSELINKRGRSVIQIIERMPLTIIIKPGHQYFSVFSSRNVPLGLDLYWLNAVIVYQFETSDRSPNGPTWGIVGGLEKVCLWSPRLPCLVPLASRSWPHTNGRADWGFLVRQPRWPRAIGKATFGKARSGTPYSPSSSG